MPEEVVKATVLSTFNLKPPPPCKAVDTQRRRRKVLFNNGTESKRRKPHSNGTGNDEEDWRLKLADLVYQNKTQHGATSRRRVTEDLTEANVITQVFTGPVSALTK